MKEPQARILWRHVWFGSYNGTNNTLALRHGASVITSAIPVNFAFGYGNRLGFALSLFGLIVVVVIGRPVRRRRQDIVRRLVCLGGCFGILQREFPFPQQGYTLLSVSSSRRKKKQTTAMRERVKNRAIVFTSIMRGQAWWRGC